MTLKSKIESLLFVAAKPFTIKKLAEITHQKKEEVEKSLPELIEEYNSQRKESGIQIIKQGQKIEMVSHPENAGIIRDYLKDEQTGELTKPSIETLTIIAYRSPITKAEIERIRGVNCSLILRNLMIRGLVEANEDKKEMVTRYQITFEFMKFLGIRDVRELPDYEKLNQDPTIEKLLNPKEDIKEETSPIGQE